MISRFSFIKKYDWVLFSVILLLLSFGLATLYSIALGQGGIDLVNFNKQLLFILVGIASSIVVSMYSPRNLSNTSKYLYFVGIFILILVLIVGKEIRGTKGWFYFGGISLQPVEFVKIFLIAYLARYFSQQRVKLNPLRHLVASGASTAVLIFLVLMQPDFGSALILFLIWASMIAITGFKFRHIMIIVLILIMIFLSGWLFFFKDYQKQRILTFVNPSENSLDQAYNITQAKIAIGSGGLFGRGLGLGSQSQLKFLPEAQNDFIFAVIAEELGFLGVCLILLFFIIFYFRLLMAIKKLNNDFEIYLVLGIGALIFIEMFINIGMNIGLMPVIGISLPFLSYGGSSIVSTLILIGLAQGVIASAKIKY